MKFVYDVYTMCIRKKKFRIRFVYEKKVIRIYELPQRWNPQKN